MERVGALLGGNAPAAQGERKNARVVVPVRMRQQRLSQSRREMVLAAVTPHCRLALHGQPCTCCRDLTLQHNLWGPVGSTTSAQERRTQGWCQGPPASSMPSPTAAGNAAHLTSLRSRRPPSAGGSSSARL